MRTTVTVEDALAKELKGMVRQSGRSFKQVVNDALRAGIRSLRIANAPRLYRLIPQSMGDVESRFNLDKALLLGDRLEDEELAHMRMLRK